MKNKSFFDDDEWRVRRVFVKLDKIEKKYNAIYTPKQVPSSINLKISKPYALEHNARTADDEKLEAKYTYKEFESLNEYSCTNKEARQKYDEYLKEATQNYYERTWQKIQDKTNGAKFRWGCVVNINANHTLDDIENLADKLCEKYGWQKLQVAIHRDEGHYKKDENGEFLKDENGKKIFDPNLHAHIEFFMLDKQGIYCFKKQDFGKKTMRELQSFVADELGMERGIDKRISKTERLEHRQYRQEARKQEILEAKNEKQKLTIKKLNQTINDLRGQLQQNHATRADYAKLEQEAKDLKEALRKKELERAEFEKRIQALQEWIKNKLIVEYEKKLKEKDEQIEVLQAQLSTLNEKVAEYTTQSLTTQENANPSPEQQFLKQIDEKGLKRPEYLEFYQYYKPYIAENGMLTSKTDIKEKNELNNLKSKFVDDEKTQEILKQYKPIQSTEKLVIEYYQRKGIETNNIPLYPLQRALNRVNEINKNKGFDYDR